MALWPRAGSSCCFSVYSSPFSPSRPSPPSQPPARVCVSPCRRPAARASWPDSQRRRRRRRNQPRGRGWRGRSSRRRAWRWWRTQAPPLARPPRRRQHGRDGWRRCGQRGPAGCRRCGSARGGGGLATRPTMDNAADRVVAARACARRIARRRPGHTHNGGPHGGRRPSRHGHTRRPGHHGHGRPLGRPRCRVQIRSGWRS